MLYLHLANKRRRRRLGERRVPRRGYLKTLLFDAQVELIAFKLDRGKRGKLWALWCAGFSRGRPARRPLRRPLDNGVAGLSCDAGTTSLLSRPCNAI